MINKINISNSHNSLKKHNTSSKGSLSFGRALTKSEEKDYQATILSSLNALGKNNVAMILPSSSLPSAKGEDTGVGSFNTKGGKDYLKFINLHGFNVQQKGPEGYNFITKGEKETPDALAPSPYVSSIFSGNILYVDLKQLTTEKYSNILSNDTFDKIVENNPNKNQEKAAIFYANEEFNVALEEAYDNFNSKKATDKNVYNLNNQFIEFKHSNSEWLEKDSLYYALSNKYNEGNYNDWTGPKSFIDKDLNINGGYTKAAKFRKQQLLAKPEIKKDTEMFKFGQFILDKQTTESMKEAPVKNMSDALIGFSKMDIWANPDAFLENRNIGCMFGGENGLPQLWGIESIDPNKLFNNDDSLGVAGKLLHRKFKKLIDNFDGTRIDHLKGLFDPAIYRSDARSMAEANKQPTNGDHYRWALGMNNLSELDDRHIVDAKDQFKRIVPEIIEPLLAGKEKLVIAENLGEESDDYNNNYKYNDHNKELMPGIVQTMWDKGETAPENTWVLTGTHDHEPISNTISSWMEHSSDDDKNYLSGYTHPDNPTKREQLKGELYWDKINTAKAKFVEMFISPAKNVQIPFMDFMGLTKSYNKGGENNSDNWKLRISNNFKDAYYANLEKDNHKNIAFNMPEILKTALESKREFKISRGQDLLPENKFNKLISKLSHYENVLKEKSALSESNKINEVGAVEQNSM